jgi:WD40 repeat protein
VGRGKPRAVGAKARHAHRADTSVRVWDLATGKEKITLLKGHPDTVRAVAFSADGKYVAAGVGYNVIDWEVATGKIRLTVRMRTGSGRESMYEITTVAFSPDGKTLASADAGSWAHLADIGGNTELVAARGDEPLRYVFHYGPPRARTLAFNSDSKVLLVAGEVPKQFRERTTGVVMAGINVAKRVADRRLEADWDHAFNCLALSPDGAFLAAGDDERKVQLFDFTTRRHKATLTGHRGPVRAVAFSPDSNLFASGADNDNTVRLWDAETRKLVTTLPLVNAGVRSLRFASKTRLVAVDAKGRVRTWELAK